MVSCAVSGCYNEGHIHVGLKKKVRLLCSTCYIKVMKKGIETPKLKVYNPQETLFRTEKQKKVEESIEIQEEPKQS